VAGHLGIAALAIRIKADAPDAEQRDDVIGDLASRLAKLDEKQGPNWLKVPQSPQIRSSLGANYRENSQYVTFHGSWHFFSEFGTADGAAGNWAGQMVGDLAWAGHSAKLAENQGSHPAAREAMMRARVPLLPA